MRLYRYDQVAKISVREGNENFPVKVKTLVGFEDCLLVILPPVRCTHVPASTPSRLQAYMTSLDAAQKTRHYHTRTCHGSDAQRLYWFSITGNKSHYHRNI
jgi:hypothetical protein